MKRFFFPVPTVFKLLELSDRSCCATLAARALAAMSNGILALLLRLGGGTSVALGE